MTFALIFKNLNSSYKYRYYVWVVRICTNDKREGKMEIQEIKETLMKEATIFKTGGIRPTNELLESWIGKVSWKKENESIPKDADENEMNPLATLFLDGLVGIPKGLAEIYLITIFISPNVYEHLANVEGYFCIRMYKKQDVLIPCEYINEDMKAFPLVPKAVYNDMPVWDGGGIPLDIMEEILRLEDCEDIEYYEDIKEDSYSMHKIGGYPAYVQAGGWDEENFEFAFQISSDEKATLNIIDNGSFYFFYCKEDQKWDMQCDFY